ncbi:MAG: hypothetical protein ACQKBV_06075 [Puniceicoccales bacterium]
MNPLAIFTSKLLITRLATVVLIPVGLVAADYDDAGQSAYYDGWQLYDDGSLEPGGLGGWVFDEASVVHGQNIDIASSAGSPGDESIDTRGVAFKLHDTQGKYLELYRFFDPDGLKTNESFTLELSINGEMGYQGMDLRNNDNQTIFNFNGGKGSFKVDKADTGNETLDVDHVARAIFLLEFHQSSEDGGRWSIRQRGKPGELARGRYAGVARSIKLYGGDQKRNAAGAMYFNRMEIR